MSEFLERWKHQAALVTVYPRPEGSGLLEVRAGGRVLYLMDRTGPYTAKSGEARVILNPVAETITALEDNPDEVLVPAGISRVQATGTVLEVQPGFVVVQARTPLVVGVLDDSWKNLKAGQPVTLESLEPVHGFTLAGR